MIDYIRNQFPALKNKYKKHLMAFLDGPGGYQVPNRVIKAMTKYLTEMNANTEGAFITSKKNDEMIKEARNAFADFFNCSWDEVIFGANMTTLNFSLSQALSREMHEGDRVIITEIDHEGNRGPWLELKNREIVVDEVELDIKTCTLNIDDFKKKLTKNTKVVALNYASNGVGTFTIVDAVHYAAHKPIDVRKLGADFLLCSAYKFFGPHIGVMFAKKDILEKLNTLKVRPQSNYPPYKFETGTLNQEGIAGAAEAVEFVADIGEKYGGENDIKKKKMESCRRSKIVDGLLLFDRYEKELTKYLIEELSRIREVHIYGPPEGYPRTSTVSFTYKDCTPKKIAKYLGEKGIFVWDGDFYATRLVEKLGLGNKGGLVRIGIAPYKTKEELTALIRALNDKRSLENYCRTI
jgi:cysteine desulfurase family protein (TIGR01976 family)